MCIKELYSLVGFLYDSTRTIKFLFSKKDAATYKAYNERSGIWEATFKAPWYWFHGASMGEVNSLLPLAKKLKEEGATIVFSAITKTGVEKAAAAGFESHYFPVDRRCHWKRLIESFKTSGNPKAIIFGETELWPNFIESMWGATIPLALVNARLSEKSVRRYSKIKTILAPVLQKIKVVAASSKTSAERFVALGASIDRVKATGNAKYDVAPKNVDVTLVKNRYFGSSLPLVTLGSLRPGEEALWFEVIKQCATEDILWAVVPRHPEKFQFFAEELRKRGVVFSTASQLPSSSKSKVLLVDQMGVIEDFYASSVLAFVGGTLCPKLGGHNLFEPVRYAVPVVAGPEGETIKDIREDLVKENGIVIACSTHELLETVHKSIKGELRDVGKRGYSVYSSHTGATERILSELKASSII